MEKLIRAIILGSVLGVCTLIGTGWRAFGEVTSMGKNIKAELKEEMMDVRNRDMEWIDKRFDTIEKLYAGKVVTQPREDHYK